MIERKETIQITPTPGELAKEFCEMGADEQADFFNWISVISSRWERPFVIQLQAITDSKKLNNNGRVIMENIGVYAPLSSRSEEAACPF